MDLRQLLNTSQVPPSAFFENNIFVSSETRPKNKMWKAHNSRAEPV